jgi:hypothetical protein
MTMTLAGGLDLESLLPIGLAELNERADLLVRMDRKYLLDEAGVSAFIAALPEGTRVLEIDGHRSVEYRSLYHDTSGLDAYMGSVQRRRRRFKVRTREYGTGGCFLEVKTRRGGFTIKERIEYDSLAGRLDPLGMTYVTERLADAGIPLAADVLPTLWTAYRRTTLLLVDETRVTIDTDLVWSSLEADSLQCDGLIIVETKSGRQASTADRVLWAAGHRPVSLSKYGTGLAALNRDLPSNRWHRLLTRRLGLDTHRTGPATSSSTTRRSSTSTARDDAVK